MGTLINADVFKAMSELTTAVENLAKVAETLNENLRVIAEKTGDSETGQCHDYFCRTQPKHDHGLACSSGCGCKKNPI